MNMETRSKSLPMQLCSYAFQWVAFIDLIIIIIIIIIFFFHFGLFPSVIVH
ncbi:hypothetical protein E2C01_094282 [Portunus trituberculatus]|uniref:Uncharacterized protein n=1 Tax=Portunus trituberculatus TaxID=210409 RepID=A0A5B7JX65_PORTR|nr:hypothetical protein [Portunus trituberculatus]